MAIHSWQERMVNTFFTIVVYLILFSCKPSIVFAQSQPLKKKIKFHRLELSQGLSHSNVTDITHDKYGYLWIGTEDGVNRYDGYTFKIYKNDPEDTLSLLRNSINSIFEDSSGKLWITTRGGGGVHVYDRSQDKFIRIHQFNKGCDITRIFEDDDHNLWAVGSWGRNASVVKIDTVTNSITPYNILKADDNFKSMLQSGPDEYWLGSFKSGVVKWNSKTGKTQVFRPDPKNKDALVGENITVIKKDQHGNIWIGSRQGLSKLNPKNNTFRNFVHVDGCTNCLPVSTIVDLCVDGDLLWISTENGGLTKFNFINEEFTSFQYDRHNPLSVTDNSVWCVHKDAEGRIWIGTFSKGICVIDEQREKFYELDVDLVNNVVNAVYEDHRGRTWIGTEGGLVMTDHGKVTYFRADKRPGSLSSDPILSIYEDSEHQLWFGTWNGGVNKYDETSGKFIVFKPNKNDDRSLSDPNVYAITELKKTKKLVVSSYWGLNILDDLKGSSFRKVVDKQSFSNNFVRTLFEDSGGNLWVGSVAELNKVNIETGARERFYLNGDSTVYDAIINFITEDSRGHLWVCTNYGLHELVNSKRIHRYTVKEGLPSNIVSGMLEAGDGTFWISTSNGLCHFDTEGKVLRNYFVADGLLSNEFNPKSCMQSKDRVFYFGGSGVIVFDPLKIRLNKKVPPVYITGLKVFNRWVKPGEKNSILTKDISVTKEISLPEGLNFFSLEFVGINLTVSEMNQYSYKLEGFSDEWVYTGTQRFATFTNLEPGTYVFMVKASNNDGVWNEEGAKLIIHIIPKWYRSMFFKVGASLLISFLLVGFYLLRINNAERRRKQLEVVVAERTSELRMANEELSLREYQISLQNDQLLNQKEELATQNEKLTQQAQELTAQNEALRNSKIQQLELYKQKLVEKADIIEKVSTELKEVRENQTMPTSVPIEKLSKILQSHILTDSDWESFKAAFNEVYPNFFASVRYHFPEITVGEIRLAALIKLNLNTKEAASMLGISSESVRKSRYRLKKKLQIDEDGSLEGFIQKIN